MGLLKKYLYKVVWSYDEWLNPTIELIRARDMSHAWKKIKKQHSFPITLVAIERIEEN